MGYRETSEGVISEFLGIVKNIGWDEALTQIAIVLCRLCDAKARSQNAPKRKTAVPKATGSVLLACSVESVAIDLIIASVVRPR